MRALRRIGAALATGGFAGLAALGLDQLLDVLTRGHALAVAPRFVAAYAVAGAVAAVLAEPFFRRRRRGRAASRFAAALALLYAPPTFERLFSALEPPLGTAAAATAAALAVAVAGAWIWWLRRVAGSWPVALLSGAAALALLLAVRRNLIEGFLAPAALAADAAVLAAAAGFALLVRAAGMRRATAAAVLVLAMAAATLHRLPRTGSADPRATGKRPANLLLVVIDTLRQDVFQAVLADTEEGRALGRRLEGAVWFDRAVAAAPWTSPSVASILTGLYPAEHGFGATAIADGLPEALPTLAGKLESRGYHTEALVANPILYPASGIYRGFRRYEVLSGPTARLPLLTALARLRWVREDPYQDAAAVRRRLASRLGDLGASGRPLFLWLLLMDPHPPWREHRDLSPDPAAAGLPPEERLYRDEVRFVLRELARGLDLFADRELWRDTLLVLVSDHGEMFPSDGHCDGPAEAEAWAESYGRHGHALYRELVRVPLVVRPPGAAGEGRRVDVLTSHVDLHDTILDLLELDAPRIGRERASVAPWVAPGDPEAAPRRRAALSSSTAPRGQRALETAEFKLIETPRGSARGLEVFDVGADPQERRNLAAERPQLATGLARLLETAWSGQTAPPPAARPALHDPVTLERLRALGYVP